MVLLFDAPVTDVTENMLQLFLSCLFGTYLQNQNTVKNCGYKIINILFFVPLVHLSIFYVLILTNCSLVWCLAITYHII